MSKQRSFPMLFCLLFFPFMLAGCLGEYRLVSFGIEGRGSVSQWPTYSPPRDAEQPLEVAVLEAAEGYRTVPFGDFDVMFVDQQKGAKIVAVVERLKEGCDFFDERHVTRYKIVGGKIAAQSPVTVEMFPDLQFERACIISARKAKSPDPVMLYESEAKSLTLAGRLVGNCLAVVKIYESGDKTREPLAEKRVPLCY